MLVWYATKTTRFSSLSAFMVIFGNGASFGLYFLLFFWTKKKQLCDKHRFNFVGWSMKYIYGWRNVSPNRKVLVAHHSQSSILTHRSHISTPFLVHSRRPWNIHRNINIVWVLASRNSICFRNKNNFFLVENGNWKMCQYFNKFEILNRMTMS